MTRQTLLWVLAALFCFSQFSNAQETSYTYDGTLTQDDIDQSVLYGSPDDIDLMDEGKTYMDQIIDNEVIPYTDGTGREWQATTGCLNASEDNGGDGSWGGTSGGSCANIGTNGDGAIRFGYNTTIAAQTQSAIAEALKIAGITVVGYRWQWKVKNANANDTSTVQMNNQDPLIVTITVKDPNGNVLDEREWDYSYYIAGWELKYGMHWYDPFISGNKIDTITIEVEGRDAGYWAGYWGPEFREAGIYSIFVVEPPPEPDCEDPLLDPTCPGYADALNAQQDEMLALINNSSDTGINTGNDVAFVAEITAVVEESIDTASIEISESTQEVEPAVEEVKNVYERGSKEVSEVVSAKEVVEATEESTEESANTPSVNALAVAQSAVSTALNEAASNVSNTLEATLQSVADAEAVFKSNEQQLQQLSQAQSAETQLLSDNIQEANQAQLTEQASIELSSQQNVESNIAEMQNEQQNLSMTQQQDSNSSTLIDNSGNIDPVQFVTQQSNISTVLSALENNDIINQDIADNQISIEVVVDSFEIAALNMAIDEVFQAALNRNLLLNTEEKKEEEQKSFEEQNAEEDALVAAAQSGDDSEDAQAALLGYNPNFRAYQQPQLPDIAFYLPKEIYTGQKNYDNPNSRFFNGASDTLHREMVRQQYEGN